MTTHSYFTADAAVSINPSNGEEVGRFAYLTDAELDAVLERSRTAFRAWSVTPARERAAVMGGIAKAIRANLEKLAQMATREMGKPITQARAEVEKCATLCDWCAQHGEALVRDEPTSIGEQAYVSYLPLGPVLAVIPWNFPFWQILRGATGVMLGGNTYVLKHAPNVMGCAYLMAEVLLEGGLPKDVFTVLHATNAAVSKAIADSRIAAVMVTGSVRAGSAIAAQAGAAIKKSVLELGGSDPFIVLADADLERAVDAAVIGRFQNTGQICIAAKRILLESPISDAFTERFLEKVRALPVGDPMLDATYIGPMARFDLRDEMHEQVERSVTEGARVFLGGHKLEGAGNFYAPTVLAGVKAGMTSFREEVFGPVASLIVAQDAEDAIGLANDSEFGLCASLWTADHARAVSFARRLDTGGLFINGIPASDPRVPIGGVKKSGYGRELSHHGVREFMNAQTVWLERK